MTTTLSTTVLVFLAAALWGPTGHAMVGRAAAERLPDDMPAFFRNAGPRLAWLNAEPDRWRGEASRELDEAFKYDHYIDLENVPAGALEASDRFAFLAALYRAGLEDPERDAGFLPFRIVELYQRLENGFARWRSSPPGEERAWIEARILNDAGILGHYVADAAQPHHTTIHFNGWSPDAPNPAGYTTDREFHWRFESLYVDANIAYSDVLARVPVRAPAIRDVRAAVMRYIMDSHAQVVPLYAIEQSVGFDPDRTGPEAEAFTLDRLAAGADMLRALWHAAWVASEDAEIED